MKIALVGAGILLTIIVIVVAAGYALPVKHHVSREATYSMAPDSLFALLTDVEHFPEWRPSVKRVERVTAAGDSVQYREIGDDGAVLFSVDEVRRPTRMVTRIADPSLPFGGRWTYDLMPVAAGTTLRITEDGEVYTPLFRFMSKYVFTHHRTIDTYLRDLSARVGESVQTSTRV